MPPNGYFFEVSIFRAKAVYSCSQAPCCVVDTVAKLCVLVPSVYLTPVPFVEQSYLLLNNAKGELISQEIVAFITQPPCDVTAQNPAANVSHAPQAHFDIAMLQSNVSLDQSLAFADGRATQRPQVTSTTRVNLFMIYLYGSSMDYPDPGQRLLCRGGP